MRPTNETRLRPHRDPTLRYFDEIASIDVMTPDEERASAARIDQLRVTLWHSLLAYAPLADGIAELAATTLEGRAPSQQLSAYRRAARAVRDRPTKSSITAFERAQQQLALHLANSDPDGELSGALVHDFSQLARRRLDGVRTTQRRPNRGNRRFDEHVRLIQRNAEALKKARNAFAEANLRLVVMMARRFVNDHLGLDDLVQEGNLGLMKAIDRFDHRRGLRFSTYACWWIRHAIQRAIANKGRTVRVPCHMGDAHARVRRARWELQGRLGRTPTTSELAEATKVSTEKIESMDQLVLGPLRSLDAPMFDGEGERLVDTLADTDTQDPLHDLELDRARSRLAEALTELSPIEVDVLRKRFGLGDRDELTLRTVGQHHSLSRERIRQIQQEALEKLRRRLTPQPGSPAS